MRLECNFKPNKVAPKFLFMWLALGLKKQLSIEEDGMQHIVAVILISWPENSCGICNKLEEVYSTTECRPGSIDPFSHKKEATSQWWIDILFLAPE